MPTRLGQNFLKDTAIIQKIISSADLQPDDFIIEIGPGKGMLTEKLAAHAGKIIAIEIDTNLIPSLQEKFNDQKNVEIINADILKINLPQIHVSHKIPDAKYKVIANIPYYITSPIIRLFLEQSNQPQEMILMIQKEVAERITAQPGEMSILAVAVQYYANAEILFEVSKDSFDPVPQVDSAVIKIVPRRNFDKETDKQFFKIVRAGFSAKRKTLINNLSNGLHLDKKEIGERIKKLGLRPNVRAQELSVDDWKKLTSIMQQ